MLNITGAAAVSCSRMVRRLHLSDFLSSSPRRLSSFLTLSSKSVLLAVPKRDLSQSSAPVKLANISHATPRQRAQIIRLEGSISFFALISSVTFLPPDVRGQAGRANCVLDETK